MGGFYERGAPVHHAHLLCIASVPPSAMSPPPSGFISLSGYSRCCIRTCSAMVGVPQSPLLPSLPTHLAPRLPRGSETSAQRKFFIDNLLVRIHLTIQMVWWIGLAPREFQFPFPGSLVPAYLLGGGGKVSVDVRLKLLSLSVAHSFHNGNCSSDKWCWLRRRRQSTNALYEING